MPALFPRRKRYRPQAPPRRKRGRYMPRYRPTGRAFGARGWVLGPVANSRPAHVYRPEIKNSDFRVSPTELSDTWTTLSSTMIALAQGDDYNQRDGEKAYFHSLQIRGYILFPSEGTTAGSLTDKASVVRLALVLDKFANGSAITASDVWESLSGTVETVNQYRELSKTRRFKVLRDIRIPINVVGTWQTAAGTAETLPVIVPFSFTLKFRKPLVVYYSGTGAAIANVMANNIAFFATSTWNDAGASDEQPRVHANCRLRFHS